MAHCSAPLASSAWWCSRNPTIPSSSYTVCQLHQFEQLGTSWRISPRSFDFEVLDHASKLWGRRRESRRTSALDTQPITISCTAEDNIEVKFGRRQCLSPALICATSILLGQLQGSLCPAMAEEGDVKQVAEEGGTFVDGVLSLLDPDQMTKSGKKLPKKYVKSVREVVKSLRESFQEDTANDAKFRRNADSAKEAIREYLQDWRGSKIVSAEVCCLLLASPCSIHVLGICIRLSDLVLSLPSF